MVATKLDEDCMLSTLPVGVGIAVRIDLVRRNHGMIFPVITVSVHLLEELVLLPNAAVVRLLVEGQLPKRVAELARISGTRVGLVIMDQILMCGRNGVTLAPREDLADARVEGTKAWCDDFEVHDVVAS